jgi:trimethylamine--corrinoid protein Co-methyltransferase
MSQASRAAFPYLPLAEDDIQRIHECSMQVLQEVGFEVQGENALRLFRGTDASIDSDRRVVRMKEKQVLDLLASAPEQVKLYGRDPDHDVVLGAGRVYFGTGGTALNVLDENSGERRPATLLDLIDIIRIVQALDNIHLLLLPTYPNDIPVRDVDAHRFFAGFCYTTKHVMGGIYTLKGMKGVIRMAEEIAGGPEALKERPFISMIACGISPLRLDKKYGSFMIHLARDSIPAAVPVEPLSGATAPASLAGTLVIQNCDGLINVMLTQLANPGAPVIYGSVAASINFRDMSYLGGPVESGLINAATAQLARRYRLPYYSTAGISDSKTLDAQCGYETAVNNLLVALAGGDFIHDAAGLMEFANTVSKEKLVIDNDVLGMVQRALQGITVDEQSLAFEEIRSAGPGGNFISGRHTRTFMHRDHYIPQLTNRDKRESWEADGRPTAATSARAKVQSILNSPPELKLDQKTADALLGLCPQLQSHQFPGYESTKT